ncbi:MAG: oxidoreductase, partial [Rhodococcus sp. (in: high G+C Gram-positive bacteria)]
MKLAEFPTDLRGRPRTDRTMLVIGTILSNYLRAAERREYRETVAGHNPDRAMQLVVTGREVVAADEDVAAITLASPDGAELPIWHPGSHLDLHLPSGRRRQY